MSDNAKVQTISREVRCPLGYDPSETTRRVPPLQEEAYLLGALHDGTYNRYNNRYRFSQKGTSWLKVLRDTFKKIGHGSWIYKEGKNRDVYVLETRASFLDINFDPVKLSLPEEKRAYIRGFFDAEGGIPHNKNARFYIQLTQKDREKIMKLKNMLESLNIKTGKIHNPSVRVDPNYWRIFVLASSQLEFAKQINSWHPNKQKRLEERNMI